jgi:hypothetical protein
MYERDNAPAAAPPSSQPSSHSTLLHQCPKNAVKHKGGRKATEDREVAIPRAISTGREKSYALDKPTRGYANVGEVGNAKGGLVTRTGFDGGKCG